MSGQRGMTGKPLFLKCSQCKKRRDQHGSARSGKLMRTGRKRPYTVRGAKGRTPPIAYECRCGDCGHVGWYAHADAVKLRLGRPPESPDFEPGFLEALNALRRLAHKADRHNDLNGPMELWSVDVAMLADAALVLLDRYDRDKAKADLLKNFRYGKKPT